MTRFARIDTGNTAFETQSRTSKPIRRNSRALLSSYIPYYISFKFFDTHTSKLNIITSIHSTNGKDNSRLQTSSDRYRIISKLQKSLRTIRLKKMSQIFLRFSSLTPAGLPFNLLRLASSDGTNAV